MDEHSAKKIIASMMFVFSNYKPTDVDYAAEVWADMLEEYTYEQASMGLKAYIKSDTSGFAPTPGQIIDKIHSLTEPTELNEMEAWSLVSKAIRNSGYNSVEEFAKLPSIVQKAVGLPDQLRVWALDEHYNEGVVRGHFINCYKPLLEREREIQKIPQEVRNMITKVNLNAPSGQIEQKRQQMIESANERKQREIKALEDKREGIPPPSAFYEAMEGLKNE